MNVESKVREKQRNSQGITLVALVVTLVILIILATVSISAVFGENGLIKKAQEARDHQSNAIAMEQGEMDKLVAEYANVMSGGPSAPADITGPTVNIAVGTVTETSIAIKATAIDESGLAESETYKYYLNGEEKDSNTTGEYTFEGLTAGTKYTIKVEVKDKVGNLGSATRDVTTSVPTISISTNYVGYYANLDDDPEPDGVIYADQATGKKGDGQWGHNGTYTIPKISSGLKSYTISETKYSGKFGNKEVISVVEGSQGTDRFYVMALEDIDSSTHRWNASGRMSVVTQTGFGTGKTNTAAVMAQYTGDMWGLIGNQVAQGWFVPSKEEWSAFAEELGIASSYYPNFGLGDYYWSSSQGSTSSAWRANFNDGSVYYNGVGGSHCVRLSATF